MKVNFIRVSKLLVLLALIYGAICVVLALLQRKMIYLTTPERYSSVPFIEMQLPGAVVRVSVHSRPSQRAILYFGGNAEVVSDSVPELASVFPNTAIYAMHYRGYSGSTGKPSEAALHSDARALYELARQSHSEIVVVGRSLGSGVAVRLAAENEVSNLVLATPFDSLVNVGKYHFPWLPVGWLLTDRFESWRYAPKIAAPTYVLIAENDEVIPRHCADNLVHSFSPGICKVQVMAGANHNSLSIPSHLLDEE